MLHLLFTFSALAVVLWLLVRMSSRDHVADPIAMVIWLTLCFFNTYLLGLVSTMLVTAVVWSSLSNLKTTPVLTPSPR